MELNDGVYHGEGMGNNGSIEVDVTIEEGQITDIVFTKFVDDKEYFNEEIDSSIFLSCIAGFLRAILLFCQHEVIYHE